MTIYEEVKNQSTEEYFKGNQFSIDAFNKKYKINKDETYIQAIKRVCDFVASVEKTSELQKYWSERWFDELYNDWWHPAGSIMQGANSSKKISLMNCSTTYFGTNHPEQEWDNLESIIKNVGYNVAKSAAYRQGQGICFDRLRPAGMSVENSSKISIGTLHWMKFIDGFSNFIGQYGRIPALHFALSCKHPDIVDFIKSKSDLHSIQNANISVHCTDDFYKAVLENKDWELLFEIPEAKQGQKIYVDIHSIDKDCQKDNLGWYYLAKKDRKYEKISKIVKARKLLELIAKGMTIYAEPGIQNIDIARKYSNSDYVYDENDEYDSRICSSNACCVSEDTKILTNKGNLTIKELKELLKIDNNIFAISYNIEKKIYELKPIINIWQQRNDVTIELTIEEDGKIFYLECSADHQIYTKNRGYVQANSLMKNDDITIFS